MIVVRRAQLTKSFLIISPHHPSRILYPYTGAKDGRLLLPAGLVSMNDEWAITVPRASVLHDIVISLHILWSLEQISAIYPSFICCPLGWQLHHILVTITVIPNVGIDSRMKIPPVLLPWVLIKYRWRGSKLILVKIRALMLLETFVWKFEISGECLMVINVDRLLGKTEPISRDTSA